MGKSTGNSRSSSSSGDGGGGRSSSAGGRGTNSESDESQRRQRGSKEGSGKSHGSKIQEKGQTGKSTGNARSSSSNSAAHDSSGSGGRTGKSTGSASASADVRGPTANNAGSAAAASTRSSGDGRTGKATGNDAGPTASTSSSGSKSGANSRSSSSANSAGPTSTSATQGTSSSAARSNRSSDSDKMGKPTGSSCPSSADNAGPTATAARNTSGSADNTAPTTTAASATGTSRNDNSGRTGKLTATTTNKTATGGGSSDNDGRMGKSTGTACAHSTDNTGPTITATTTRSRSVRTVKPIEGVSLASDDGAGSTTATAAGNSSDSKMEKPKGSAFPSSSDNKVSSSNNDGRTGKSSGTARSPSSNTTSPTGENMGHATTTAAHNNSGGNNDGRNKSGSRTEKLTEKARTSTTDNAAPTNAAANACNSSSDNSSGMEKSTGSANNMGPTTTTSSATPNSNHGGGRIANAIGRVMMNANMSSVPISDPEELQWRERQNKIKCYSQTMKRDQPPPGVLKKKQHSLEFSSAAAAAAAVGGSRSFSYPHYPSQEPEDSPRQPDSVALPEFIANGGGIGIFKLPVRAPMHPGRPPPLEVRPHPLRETQMGCFLRDIACTHTQLWAAQESGVRYWEFSRMFGAHKGNKSGDEESAPFRESSRTSPTMCLVVDDQRGLVWTGHKDGKIRSWRTDQEGRGEETEGSSAESGSNNFKEGLSWHAHRCPVLSLIVTSSGELWSGHEGGVIKAWPWKTVQKSLSLTVDERHMAALLIERSFVDLRSMVTAEGVCPLPSVHVRLLLSDNSRSKVWSGGSQSIALWDSQRKELLKVFGINGHVETQIDPSPSQDSNNEDDVKPKLSSNSKKEKSHGSGNFLTRSRNALLGAADAVRRVAGKGSSPEDSRKVVALGIAMDGIIWIGCSNGSLIQWDGNGNRLQEFQHRSSAVQCICSFGDRIWIGYANGSIQVMDLEGNLLAGWVAHSGPIIKMSVGGPYIFTLANSGGLRGWYLASPGPIDNILRTELASKEQLYSKQESFKFLAGTWNVGQERATCDSLITWLGCAASEVGLVVIGLQEIEMGAGFLAMAAAKETIGLEGSANGQWWLDAIGKTLDEGSFERVGSRQLAGLLIGVWARKNLKTRIGDVDVAAVPCGLGRAIGNKGGVGVRMRVYGRIICFVNCHLAAHLEAVNKRNADFDHIYRCMVFGRAQSSAAASSVQLQREANPTDTGKPELSEADMVVFLGDFNYRLRDISYDEARDLVSQRCFDWLREKDQLRGEMKAGKVFQGMREAQFKFPPTYKFDRNKAGVSGYDSGEKKRIPAWCDRILYRDTRSDPAAELSLECPVVSSITEYDACLDVTGSDHKPVRGMFTVDIARVDQLTKRQQYGELIASNEKAKELLQEYLRVPETVMCSEEVILPKQDAFTLGITNKSSKDKAVFEITGEVEYTFKDDANSSEVPRSPPGFPGWLKVTPATGVINPDQTVEISLRQEEYRTLEDLIDGASVEDIKDQEAILTVTITSNFSTERKSHRVRVHQNPSAPASCKESNSSLTKSHSTSKRR